MKKIPLRIFIIVLITGIIGVTGMVVLKYNIDKLSNTYHVIMDEHAVNQDYMKSIMTHLYQHKSQVMDHILANSEDMYDKYVDIYFVDFIRCEKKFNSIEDLRNELSNNKQQILDKNKK